MDFTKGSEVNMTYGTPNITRAKYFSEIAHAGQVYAGEVPYTVHLDNVVNVLARFNETGDVMVCAGRLHDSVEDTNTSYNDIAKRFGLEVAELVYAVTNELGRNRKEKAEKTYPKIHAAGLAATRLKLADRIANVEYGMANGGKNDMYKEEYRYFRNTLFVAGENSDMWNYLDKLLA
jgi:(p)ppGpp synthase/HD superfamily hydrolase